MKHLVDLDDEALDDARSALGTRTIKDTVNGALRMAAGHRRDELTNALDELAELAAMLPLEDRSAAW